MAGNIIPAIATTNAIISGLIVLQALHLLRATFDSLRNVHAQFKPSAPLSAIKLSLPNPHCGVCRDAYALLQCDPSRVTLAEVLEGILDGLDREVSTYEDKRVLSDPDFDDNLDRTLESLSVTKVANLKRSLLPSALSRELPILSRSSLVIIYNLSDPIIPSMALP